MSDLARPDARRLAKRLDAQLLRTRAGTGTEGVLDRILAVQAQDPRGARLAVRARSHLGTVSDVDDALTHRRTAVISWLNRGTLHLVAADDYWWLHPLTAPQVRPSNDRRLRQLGLEAREVDRGVETVVGTLADRGPQTRAELRHALEASRVRTEGQALVHLLAAASLRGDIVRGPMRSGQSAFVGVRAWLGRPPAPLDEPEALGRLARRYLAGHGPATADDLAKWAGITLRRSRAGLDVIAEECVVEDGGSVDLAARPGPGGGPDLADRPGPARESRVPPMPKPSLLGAFDPVLHGWVDRSPLVGGHGHVVTSNGLFRATALVRGRVAGIWGLADGRVRLRPLEPVTTAVERALAREARCVLEFLGLPRAPMVVEPPESGDR